MGKHGVITTRDLIKWGKRNLNSVEDIACEGYMLLAEKLRNDDEKNIVKEVICSVCKHQIDSHALYSSITSRHSIDDLRSLCEKLRCGFIQVEGIKDVAITYSLRRLWTLVSRCVEYSEPALLIGETGSGKTTVCQLIGASRNQNVRILNCHQSIETSDILGSLRPIRGRDTIYKNISQLAVKLEKSVVAYQREINIIHELEHQFFKEILSSSGESKTDIVFGLISLSEKIPNTITALEDNGNSNLQELFKCCESIKSVTSSVLAHLNSFVEVQNMIQSSRKKKKREIMGASQEGEEDIAIDRLFYEWKSVKESLSSIHEYSNNVKLLANEIQEQYHRYHSLFEWQDGPLIQAMKGGDVFVLDEINLAEDAIIERLNSVLEFGRTITLAEKGDLESHVIIAHPNFKFLATMNPGGDFGKRELSPALRSRFTEIYVPTTSDYDDMISIISEQLKFSENHYIKQQAIDTPYLDNLGQELATIMVDFVLWLKSPSISGSIEKIEVSTRELLAWTRFISLWLINIISTKHSNIDIHQEAYYALFHGIHMVVLDGLGLGVSTPRETIHAFKESCLNYLLKSCPNDYKFSILQHIHPPTSIVQLDYSMDNIRDEQSVFSLGSFSIPLSQNHTNPGFSADNGNYVMTAKISLMNMWRILRAFQIPRPILLEGPPVNPFFA